MTPAQIFLSASYLILLHGCNSDSHFSADPPPLIAPFPMQEQSLCRLDAVKVSPGEKHLVFELSGRRKTSYVSAGKEIAVASTECLDSGKSLTDCSTGFQGLDGFRALQWGDGDKVLYAIENGRSLLRINFSEKFSPPTIMERKAVNREIADTVNVYGPTAANSASAALLDIERRRLDALREQPSGDVPIGVFLAPDFSAALSFDPTSLALSVSGGKAQTRKFTPLVQTPVLATSSTDAGRPVFLDTGNISLQENDDREFSATAFARPVINPIDGRIDTYFLPGGLQKNLKTTSIPPLLPHEALQSFSQAGKVAAWITADFSGVRTYRWRTADGGGVFSCAGAAGAPSQSVIELGSPGWPLAAVAAVAPSAQRTAILFGGGPAGLSASNTATFTAAQKLSRSGWNVLVVAYSGSLGAGEITANRLREKGIDALERDAESIQSVLTQWVGPQQRLLIYGESFGALPAIHLSRLLHRQHQLILVAPFIKHLDPETWVPAARTPFNRVTVESQRRAEGVLLDIPRSKEKLDSFLRETYAQPPSHARILLGFAKDDGISKITQLPPAWAEHARVVEVPGQHDFSSSQPALWRAIFDWFDAPEVAALSTGANR